MASIDIVDLRKTYPGKVEAVKGISLSIADGEMVVLVGPSGCGKSTLLRMIAGLETITDGTVSIGGRVVNAMEPAERDIAMVFQNYALYPHMTVRQNLEYGLKNRNTPRAIIDERVSKAAQILEIGTLLDRRPRQLSGGQRQRVAMGRAIVREPAVFLFDEPLSNLDAKLRVQMRGEIKQLQRRLGTTSIYVTHDQLEAMTLADQLVVLNGGRIEQIGTPLEVYRRPASTFVAAFIGAPAMNLVPARFDSGRFHLPEGTLPSIWRGGPGDILLGIRAESFHVANDRVDDGLPMQVGYIEELGAQRLVHGSLSESPVAVVVDAATEVGDTLWLTADPEALHVFDKKSGLRLG